MSIRQILVSVWQDKPLKVKDFLFLVDRFDLKTAIEVLRDLTLSNINQRITVNEAEEKLEESLFLRARRRNIAKH